MYYYSVIKENKIMPFAETWMQLEIIMLSELSQKEKGKYHMISLMLCCAVLCLVAQSFPTLCDRTDWSPPGSSVHGILQARTPE